MRRRPARFVFVFLLGTVAALIGIITSLTLTPPGRDLLARVVSDQLDRVVNGTIEVGGISGSFLYGITLENVVIRDTQGVLLAELPRARTGYALMRFLAGDVVLTELELDDPTIQIIQHHNGRMNYEDVLGLGEGDGTGRRPLVELRNVRINDGHLSIAFPWRPKEDWTPVQLDSAIAAERAEPGRVLERTPEGFRRVITLSDLTARSSRISISTPDRSPFTPTGRSRFAFHFAVGQPF